MGLQERIQKYLGRGEAPEHDPHAPVEIAVVPLVQGPLLVSALCEEGFSAYLVEAFNVRSDVRSEARIFVKRGEAEAATALLDRLR